MHAPASGYFTGKTVLAVKQDFFAKIFMLNQASMIRSQCLNLKTEDNNKPRKYEQQANKTQVLAKTKDFLPDIFFFKNITGYIKQMLKILKKRFEIIRPNRSMPRGSTSPRRRFRGLNSKGI